MERVHVVAWDPRGQLREGEVLDGNNAVAIARGQGVVLMPVDKDLANQAVTGYFYRGWGNRGWEFNRMEGGRGSPLLLFVHAGRPWLHWAVRIERVPNGGEPHGLLRMTTDSSRGANTMSGGLSAVEAPINVGALGEPDQQGGWVRTGRVQMSNSGSGYLALSLAGACQGVRVMWGAVSQTTQD